MGTKWKWRKGEGSGTQHPLFGFDGVEEIEGNKEIHFLTKPLALYYEGTMRERK